MGSKPIGQCEETILQTKTDWNYLEVWATDKCHQLKGKIQA